MLRHHDVINKWKKVNFFDILEFFSNLTLLVALKIQKLYRVTNVTTVIELIEVNGGNLAHD